MIEDKKVERQVRIYTGLLCLSGAALFAAFLIWGVPLVRHIANDVFSAKFWGGAYGSIVLVLLLWVIFQNYATSKALDEWARIKDNQYNSLKEDLKDLRKEIERLNNRFSK